MAQFRLPDVGEGLTEADVLTWRVAVGDVVAVNDVLLEIETAKSVVELPSPFAGTVTELLVAEGDTVPVGTPLLTIESAAVDAVDEASPQSSGHSGAVLVGYGTRDASRRRRRGGGTGQAAKAGKVAAKPPVRRRARELGIDLADVPHEGPVVTRADVEAWAEQIVATSTAEAPAAAPVEVPTSVPREAARPPAHARAAANEQSRHEPISHVRRATAEAMVASAFSAPHAATWLTTDVSASVDLLETMRADHAYRDTPVSILVLAARAVCLALRRHEDLHAHWAAHEIVYPVHVGLGIAAATDRGLLVPVVPRADTLSTPELAERIHQLVTIAREGRLQPEQMSGGTFTLTNVGVFGVDGGTPILPPGQSGILAIGAVARRPWVDPATDEVVARWVMTLSLSFDHRVVDGVAAATFLADVGKILSNPAASALF